MASEKKTEKQLASEAASALGRIGGKNSRKNMPRERATELARKAVSSRKDRQKKTRA